MCLGIPGQVKEIFEANGLRMGKLNFGGIVKDACLEYLPEAGVGDYAIVHVGFAISKLDEAEAQESLRLFSEMGLLEEELGNPHEPDLETTKITMPFSERGAT
jgi:hydrogenase expression/formation protein HypC